MADVRLDATCIVGQQRLAAINGQLYAAKDAIVPATPGAPHLKLLQVLPHKVLLEYQGKVFELTYSDAAAAHAASASRADADGKSAGAATGAALCAAIGAAKKAAKDAQGAGKPQVAASDRRPGGAAEKPAK